MQVYFNLYKFYVIPGLVIFFASGLYAQEIKKNDVFSHPDSINKPRNNLTIDKTVNSLPMLSLNELKMLNSYQNPVNSGVGSFYYNNSRESFAELKNDIIEMYNLSFHREDPFISKMRTYLGVSRDVFVFILAVIHLMKYK